MGGAEKEFGFVFFSFILLDIFNFITLSQERKRKTLMLAAVIDIIRYICINRFKLEFNQFVILCSNSLVSDQIAEVCKQI